MRLPLSVVVFAQRRVRPVPTRPLTCAEWIEHASALAIGASLAI